MKKITKNPQIAASHKQAEAAVQNRSKLLLLLQQAYEKAVENRDKIKTFFNDLKMLIQLIVAWARGEYKDVPWTSILAALGAILYFANPLDVIPDFLGLGFIDDAFVISQAWAYIKKDVDRFIEWRVRHEASPHLH